MLRHAVFPLDPATVRAKPPHPVLDVGHNIHEGHEGLVRRGVWTEVIMYCPVNIVPGEHVVVMIACLQAAVVMD